MEKTIEATVRPELRGRERGILLETWSRLRKSKIAVAGLAIVTIVIASSIFAPWIAPYDYKAVPRDVAGNSLLPPSREHLMGTDVLGRDIFSRIVYGARVSIVVGLGAELFSVIVGVWLGLIAGYYGRILDGVLMRVTDTFFAFPSLVLAIAMMAVFRKPGIVNVIVVLSILGWTGIARVVRGQVLSVKENDYVQAIKALGASDFKIILRHILPNCMAPVLVAATIGIAGNILAEAGLSFLGLGVNPPTPSWGSMLTEGRNYLTIKPWVAVFPGLAILFTVLGYNLLGDGLRDALDPRLKD